MPLGCGCLVALGALALPRVTLFLMWVFTNRLSVAFDSFLIGFLGFVLLPYTAVFYALAYQPRVGVSGFGWFVVAMGFVMDLSAHFGGGEAGRRRYQTSPAA